MKLDLKKELKEFYSVSAKEPVIVKVPEQKIISVTGKGSPDSTNFKNAVEALFPVAYKIKFTYKKSGRDYTVMPLEGLWWAEDMQDFSANNKDTWKWTVFIVQPDFVTQEAFNSAIEEVKAKKDLPTLSNVKFGTIDEGLSVQILHIGSFADEGPTIARLHKFAKNNGFSFDGLTQKHHEIYLSDFRKTALEKLRTIIRQPVNAEKS